MKRTLLSLGVVALFASLAQAENWPNFHGPSGNGFSSETGLKLTDWGEDGPEKLWQIKINEGFGGAAISGQEVFLIDREPSESDRLLCLDLNDGSEKWEYVYEHAGKLPFAGSRGTPLVTDEAVYFVGGFGQVHRVDRKTQKADWVVEIMEDYDSEPPKWGWAQSPIKVGNVIIAAAMSDSTGLIGLDAETGEELWKTEGTGSSHSTPVILKLHGVEQAVFIASNGADSGTTISVDPATGKELWKTDLYYNKFPIPFATKVTEDQLFLTGGYSNGSMMIRVTEDWQVEKVFDIPQGTQVHPPFVIGKHLYMLANENANHKGSKRLEGGLACLDFNGKIIWNTGDKPFMGRGNMICVDGKLLIQDGEVGYLRAVDPSPDGYKELAIADVFGKKDEIDELIAKQEGKKFIKMKDFKYWSPMALSNGHLVMRGQENVVCLKLK